MPRLFRHSPGRINIAQLLLALAVLLVAGWFIYDRFIKTEEDRIRELIHGAANAARDRRPSGVSRVLADDFRGPEQIDKDLVHAWCVSVLMVQYKVVEAQLQPQPLPVNLLDEKHASVDLRASVRARIEPDAAWEDLPRRYGKTGGVPMRLHLYKGDNGWQIKSLELLPEAGGDAGLEP